MKGLNKQRKFLLLATIIAPVLVFAGLSATPVLAGPASPNVVTLVQPDGGSFEAIQFGDEWVNGYETTAGYTVVQNEQTGTWHYAILDENGRLVPSNLRPDQDQNRAIRPHLRDATPLDPSRNPFGPGSPPAHVQNLGTQSTLVILTSFSDRAPVGTTEAQWNSNFFGAANSVQDYYNEVSYGQLTLGPATESYGTANNGIVGWLNMGYPHPNTGSSTGDVNRLLTRDAIIAADPYIDYSSYDANSNGYISADELHVTVIVAGYEASSGGSPPPSVWGHRWSLGFGAVSAPTVDGVQVGHFAFGGGYTQFGEWHGTAGSGNMATIGIMVHEMGHDLNMPDLYDTDQSSEGIGEWSVMASASWLGATLAGDTPAHPSAWEKWYQGWLTPVQLQGTHTNYPVPRVEDNQSNSVIQLLDNPNGVNWIFNQTSGTGEFFLVENRQLVGYDAQLPGCGLLIWHIDETRPSDNTANADESRKLVDLEEADGNDDLDNNVNRGDPGDPYPGSSSNTTFDDASYPNSKLYSLSASGVSVTNISAGCANTKTADFTAPGGPAPTPTNTPGPSSCTTYASTDVPKTISSSGTPSVSSILSIASGGTIVDVNVLDLNGTHTYINDLDFNLTSPLGTEVQIMAQSCDSEDNFDLNLDDEAAPGPWPCPPVGGGTYQPSNPLSAYDGENSSGTWTLRIDDNANLDGGSLDGWSLEVCTEDTGPTPTNTPTATPTSTPMPPTPTHTPTPTNTPSPSTCSMPNLSIPDNNPAGVSDSLVVSSGGTVSDMDVFLDTTHTWVGDLAYTLEHVNTGTSVTIIGRPGVPASANGCDGDDINAVLDDEASSPVEDECAASVPTINGTFIPNNLLSAFDGENLNGTWTMTVSDHAGGDTGTLVEWCLLPVTSGPTHTPTATPDSPTPTYTPTPTATLTPTPIDDVYIYLPLILGD